MSLDYQLHQLEEELLPMHQTERGSLEYQKLGDPDGREKGRKCLPPVIERLLAGIPPQDEISKKKERIQKWKMLTLVSLLCGTFLFFWAYNSSNRVTSLKIEDIDVLPLPKLRLCVPFLVPTYTLVFQHFNLTHVRQPGDFTLTDNVRTLCQIDNITNSCGEFVKTDLQDYNGWCVTIGENNPQWRLATMGRDVLSLTIAYPRPSEFASSVTSLATPFFGWITDCTVQTNGTVANSDLCTKDTHFGLFTENTKNPLVLYHLEPNHLALIEVHQQNHVDLHGFKTELYPTTFTNYAFTSSDKLMVDRSCRANRGCDALFIGIRTLSQTIATTYEERYLLSVVRAFLNSAALVSVITAVCSFIFAFLITKLIFKEKQAHLDHDLREAIIYMHQILKSSDRADS